LKKKKDGDIGIQMCQINEADIFVSICGRNSSLKLTVILMLGDSEKKKKIVNAKRINKTANGLVFQNLLQE